MMLSHDQRRKAFRAALWLSGHPSVESWAEEKGYGCNHVKLVLRGERPSARLQVMLDAFAVETILSFADELRAEIEKGSAEANREVAA